MDPYHHTGVQHRFWNAVEVLVGSGRVQDRLNSAYHQLLPIREDDLPEDLREDFRELDDAMTWLPAEGYDHPEGTVKATTNAMSDAEAVRLARAIVSILHRLARGPM